MKKLLTYSCTFISACALYAEPAWFATVEIDSLQSLQMGVESYCKTAGIPLPPDMVLSDLLKEVLPLEAPDAAISFKDPIRVFVIGDSDESIFYEDGEPSLLFSLTLPSEGKILNDQLAKLYATRRDGGNVVTFSDPNDDVDLPDNLLLSVGERNKALLATSKEALAWFQKQQKLDAFLPIPGNQAFKGCFNMKQVAEAFNEFPMPDGQANPVAAIMSDIEYFSFALTPNAQALTVSYGLKAKAGSPMAALLDMLKPPDAGLWNGLPENAFYAEVGPESSYEKTAKIIEAYLKQAIPVDPTRVKLEQALTGDVLRYLVPTTDKKSLRLIDLNPVKDAAAVKEIIKTLDQSEPSPGIKFKKEESREIGQQTIERYSLIIDMAAVMRAQGADPALVNPMANPVFTVISMLAKGIVIECTVKDNYLISAVSPAGATDDWLPALPFTAPTVTLDKKIAALDPAAKPLLAAAELRVTPLLKQVVSMLPNVKPEHLALFSATTDPIQIWFSRTPDNTMVATTRIPANEVASIAKIIQNGQAALQEIAFTFFTTQIMPMMQQPPQQGAPAVQPPPNF